MASDKVEAEKPEAKQPRVEFNFPMLIVRTKRFAAVFDKLGSLRGCPVFFLVGPCSCALCRWSRALPHGQQPNRCVIQSRRWASRWQLGPGSILLLPGINPLLPIVYGWIAIVFAIIIHEGAHGVIARNVGFNVKSSGLLFFLIVPIGAFVDVDEEQIKKAKPRPALKVMAGGVGANIILAAVCLLGVLVLVGSFTPIIDDGVYIDDVTAGIASSSCWVNAQGRYGFSRQHQDQQHGRFEGVIG